MYSASDTSYTSNRGGYRKYVYAAICATAALIGGAALFGDFKEDEVLYDVVASSQLVNLVSDHRDFMASTPNSVADALEDGR